MNHGTNLSVHMDILLRLTSLKGKSVANVLSASKGKKAETRVWEGCNLRP